MNHSRTARGSRFIQTAAAGRAQAPAAAVLGGWHKTYLASPGRLTVRWFRLIQPARRAARVTQLKNGQWEVSNHAGVVYGVFRKAASAKRHADKVCR